MLLGLLVVELLLLMFLVPDSVVVDGGCVAGVSFCNQQGSFFAVVEIYGRILTLVADLTSPVQFRRFVVEICG